jgi:hypothetical protein
MPLVVCSATDAGPVSVSVLSASTACPAVTVKRMSAGSLPAPGAGAPADICTGDAATCASNSPRRLPAQT